MKVVQINTSCDVGSTGRICSEISDVLSAQGIENYILYSQGESTNPLAISYSNSRYKKFQALRSRILGNYGFNSQSATRVLLKQLDRIAPDIVHLHNIHGHDCDLEMLFKYLTDRKIKVVWTFHDCWAFTAYCPHFEEYNCDKWQNHCQSCPYSKKVSWFFDRSETMFFRKRELLSKADITVVTPSRWLADLVKQSFLKNCRIETINNGIDLSVFHPTENRFAQEYGCDGKHIVLGVAFDWDSKKGLDDFIRLADELGDKYQIVLVGTNENTDMLLPESIISIHRTANREELAKIYTAASVFVNPTREDNYPTVNMEAIACGTPVVTYKTGGSPEMIGPCCGSVVEKNDIAAMKSEIIRICEEAPYSSADCAEYAKSFDKKFRFEEYLELYRSI